jgi:ribosomal protein L7/L12
MAMLLLLLGFLILLVVSGVLVTVFLLNRNQSDQPAPYTGDLEQDARALVRAGRQIEAIRLVRKHTGVGLVEARDYVRALDQGALPEPPALVAPPMVADQELDPQIRALLAAEQKIAAVKLVRDQTGWGLKEAKDYVEYVERTNTP